MSLHVPRAPGRYDLRLRFERGGRLLRRDEALGAWLLPASGQAFRRERSRDARLARRFAALGAAYPGWAAIWTHDLRTGATAGWNSDASFPAASTVKLAVLVAALRRYGPRPERSSAWPLIRDLATWSSNEATNRLLVLLGGSEAGGTAVVNETLQRLGATSSWFTGNYRIGTGPTHALGDAPKPLPVLTFRRTTAHDLGRILAELHGAAVGNGLSARRTGTRPPRGPPRARAAALRGRGRERRPAAPVDPRPARAQGGLDVEGPPHGRDRLHRRRPADRRGADVPARRGAARPRPVRLGGT